MGDTARGFLAERLKFFATNVIPIHAAMK